MGQFIYNFFFHLVESLLPIAALFSKKLKLFVNGRKGVIERIAGFKRENTAPVAWFHCASLGEFEQARPVLEGFKKRYPQYKVVLTFFSPSGYEVRKDYAEADLITYLPIDTWQNAKRFVDTLEPSVVFFVKYEFWYNFLKRVAQKNIPLFSFSTIFREDQIFFKWYGSFFLRTLHCFDHFFVQNETSVRLLEDAKIYNFSKTGDSRFDRVEEICQQAVDLPIVENFAKGHRVLVVGSSWPQDMEVLYPLINRGDEDLKFIIAPHNLKKEEMEEVEQNAQVPCIRYSLATEENVADKKLLLIDNFGMLSSLYRYGSFAYVGGAFGAGLHNILEAATYGLPIFFGRSAKNTKFQEAVDLVKRQGAFMVKDAGDFLQQFDHFYQNEEKRRQAAEASRAYVEENLGVTDQILDFCEAYIK
ncbi:3-deoxy-D-manno-octulosonic acid transferase [Persicobacter diffluens]|uniref:3-deoxy-D-manno-octulosonic acid transferase n=1 Tax=Persicobacter diffluens TaxID=981 RepID=A0AAN4VVR0_9BACT|nr:3-deoxy-D-manno-octulosonic acid transferase [Persicobacter diffluens]